MCRWWAGNCSPAPMMGSWKSGTPRESKMIQRLVRKKTRTRKRKKKNNRRWIAIKTGSTTRSWLIEMGTVQAGITPNKDKCTIYWHTLSLNLIQLNRMYILDVIYMYVVYLASVIYCIYNDVHSAWSFGIQVLVTTAFGWCLVEHNFLHMSEHRRILSTLWVVLKVLQLKLFFNACIEKNTELKFW